SAATLALAIQRFGISKVIAIFCDTDNEDAAVYRYLAYLEDRFGITIHRLKADFSERMAIHRQRLLTIAAGGADYHPQAKFPWVRERAWQAANLMQPTGNAFLDLCMLKGMF